jgi:hypothetical protein
MLVKKIPPPISLYSLDEKGSLLHILKLLSYKVIDLNLRLKKYGEIRKEEDQNFD